MSDCKCCDELNLIIDDQLIELDEMKLKYNSLVSRFKKAEKYLNNNPHEEKWIPELRKIVNEMSGIINQQKTCGYEMTECQILNGFEV